MFHAVNIVLQLERWTQSLHGRTQLVLLGGPFKWSMVRVSNQPREMGQSQVIWREIMADQVNWLPTTQLQLKIKVNVLYG